jgi:hypothetical protein
MKIWENAWKEVTVLNNKVIGTLQEIVSKLDQSVKIFSAGIN